MPLKLAGDATPVLGVDGRGWLRDIIAADSLPGLSIDQQGSGPALALGDAHLRRDASNSLAQRNGTNPQSWALYNTYTDASNYERFFFGWPSNVCKLAVVASGTGTVRGMELSAASIWLRTGASDIYRWGVDASGNFLSSGDNQYDIGASGASRPRALYLAGLARIGGDLDHDGANAGFYGTAPATKQTVTGSRGGNAALASLLTALATIGLITDSSSA